MYILYVEDVLIPLPSFPFKIRVIVNVAVISIVPASPGKYLPEDGCFEEGGKGRTKPPKKSIIIIYWRGGGKIEETLIKKIKSK